MSDGEDAHVWIARAEEADARFLAVLSAAERERMQRFRFERDRLSYVAAHALKRFALSALVPAVPPHAWSFRYAETGKPEIEHPRVDRAPRFNLSHTHGLAACVVAAGVDCGIDVETVQRPTDIQRLAEKVLSRRERASLAAAPSPHRLFFTYWTLREAYVKARGCGLSIALDECAFRLDADAIRCELEPCGWQFECFEPTPRHVLAVALRTGSRARRLVLHDPITRFASAQPCVLPDPQTARTSR